MGRKKKVDEEPTMPIGMYKGRSLATILAADASYLCWFYEVVDGYDDIKRAIVALPDFPARLAQYRERKQVKDKTLEQKIEEVVARMFSVEPTPAEVDDLCDRLFHAPS